MRMFQILVGLFALFALVWWLAPKRQKAKATVESPVVVGDGTSMLGVVGLQYQPQAIEALFGRRIAQARKDAGDEVETGDFEVIEAAATLRLTSSNEHDPNAVEVCFAGQLVGYLPRATAGAFRDYVRKRGFHGDEFRCVASVELPLHKDDDVEISLDLPKLVRR